MDPQTVASAVTDSTWVAWIGFGSGVLGAVIGVFGTWVLHWLQKRPQRKLDEQRREYLRKMLNDPKYAEHWRKLSTLSRVIGASEATTKRLLVGIKARGSQKDDGLWGLIKYHPFDEDAQ